MRFAITAYRRDQGVAALHIDADSAEEAERLVRAQGMEPVAVRGEQALAGLGASFRRPRAGAFDLLVFSQELRALLDAGLSLIEALGAIARKHRAPASRHQVEALIRQLRQGKSFSGAVREYPEVFPPLYVALATASEQTGDLADALGRFIDYRERLGAVRERLVAALIYPAVLVGVGALVVMFLMLYVVPRFSQVYAEVGGNLPLMSRLLLDAGEFAGRYGGALLALLLALAAGVAFANRGRRRGWRGWVPLLWRWPALAPVRDRYRHYLLARFYRTIGLLLQGGLPLAQAMTMARELLDADLQAGLDRALLAVRSGTPVSEAMERGQLAPPIAGDLLRIAEKSGDMSHKMIRIADFLDLETARLADWVSRLFEPVLTLGIGLFIAGIVVLLYMPIFELAGSIQ